MSYSPQTLFTVGIVTAVVFLILCTICTSCMCNSNRDIAPYPMHVVVIGQPHYQQYTSPAHGCWTVTTEELPPPPYNAVVRNSDPLVYVPYGTGLM